MSAVDKEEYFVMIDGVKWPASAIRPDLSSHATVPASTRVASASMDDVYNGVRYGKQVVQTGASVPVVGAIISMKNGARPVCPPRAELLEVFPKRDGERPKMMDQVADFARRYAAAVRSGKMPIMLVPDARNEGGDPESDPHIQAFFIGLVAGALTPQGMLLTSSYDGHRQTPHTTSIVGDNLAIAASQGHTAIANRRIQQSGEPEWHHVAPQLMRFERQFAGFHARRAGKGYMAKDYLWDARDPRSVHGDPRFTPYHTVMLGAYPEQASSGSQKWVNGLIQLFRPGAFYADEPAHQLNALRHWLVSEAATLMEGESGTGPIILPPRPAQTPAEAALDAGDLAFAKQRRIA